MNKYHAKRTYSELCQRTFASKAECVRGEELRMLELAGVISNLEYQPKFLLCKKPKITITLDFFYTIGSVDKQPKPKTADGFHIVATYTSEIIYEDVKGVLTRDSRTKLAWLKEKEGIDVRLIR